MKALITGHMGFVGRHMYEELAHRGYAVTGMDLKSGSSGDAHLTFMTSDAYQTQWDLVVHCAYHVGGRTAIDGKPDNLHKNIMLDAALFNWALRTEQKHVLYFSSSAAYPIHLQADPSQNVRLNEDEIDHDYLEQPDGRYGFAKIAGEQMARAAIKSGLKVSVVRPFSGYGADQDLDYPFPAFITRALRHPNHFEIWGSAAQKRDWIHISDVVNGALAVVDDDARTDLSDINPVNLCTGQGISMFDLANLIMDMIGYKAPVRVLKDKPMGVMNRVGDPELFFETYEPKITLEQGIADAIKELSKC